MAVLPPAPQRTVALTTGLHHSGSFFFGVLGTAVYNACIADHTRCSHWHTHTVVAALRSTALTATAVFDGPMDNVTFRAYIEQVLAPTLRQGDVVVLDNLVAHKQPAVRAIETPARSCAFCRPIAPISIPSNSRSRN